MATQRDRFTAASSAPENAEANYPELFAVEEVGEKIFREHRGSGRMAAHIKAVRLIGSVQE